MNEETMHVKTRSTRIWHSESTQRKTVPPPSFLCIRTRFTNIFRTEILQIVMIKFSIFKNLRMSSNVVIYIKIPRKI